MDFLSAIRYKAHELMKGVLYLLLFVPKKPSNLSHLEELEWMIGYRYRSRREHYINAILSFIFYNSIYDLPGKIYYKLQNRFSRWAFYRGTEFVYSSPHYITRKGNEHMDGYLTFKWKGLTRMISVDMMSLDCLRSDATIYELKTMKKHSTYLDLNKYGKWGWTTLLIPKKTFNEKDIKYYLEMWHRNQMRDKFKLIGNQDEMPEIKYDFNFEEDMDKDG